MTNGTGFDAIYNGDAELTIAFEKGPGDALKGLESAISDEKGVVETKGAVHGACLSV